MDQTEKELREVVKPIIEDLVYQLVCLKPENSVIFFPNLD